MLTHIVICGVSGAGKSTVAQRVAQALDGDYIDADDFHSEEAKQKMSSGIALTDEDRLPWLERLANYLNCANRPVVLACSALKPAYRSLLNVQGRVRFIVLKLSPAVAKARVRQRGNQHFMPDSLVESQFAALDVSSDCAVVDAEQSIDDVIRDCLIMSGGLPVKD